MRKKLFTIAGAALITVMSLTACSKNADKPGGGSGATYTKQQLVGTYHAVSITTLTSSQNIINSVLDPCEQDDYQVLNEDMTSEYIDAGESCEPDGSDEGTWSITGNQLKINTQTVTIQSLNQTQMVVIAKLPVGESSLTDVKVTFERD